VLSSEIIVGFKSKTSVILICLVLATSACRNNESYIVKIDSISVSPQEFQLRFNYNPFLKEYDFITAQKKVLKELITEKILSLKYQNDYPTMSTSYADLLDQHLLEATLEQIRLDSIENTVTITQEEVYQEYHNMSKKFHVQYVVFDSQKDAKAFKSKVETGADFQESAIAYYKKQGVNVEKIPERILSWSSDLIELEEKIFRLEVNEISDPIFAFDEFYLIKVKNILETGQNTPVDFEKRKILLYNDLKERKIKKLYFEFYNKYLRNNLAQVYWIKVKMLLDYVSDSNIFSDIVSNPAMRNQDKSLNILVTRSLDETSTGLKNEIVVRFKDGRDWSVEYLLKKLKIGPYIFNYSSENDFRRSFARNVELLIEHDALFDYAKSIGYLNDSRVIESYEMWKEFYTAQSFIDNLKFKSNKSYSDTVYNNNQDIYAETDLTKSSLNSIENSLITALSEYDIKINSKLYSNMNLKKTDMVVKKTHFPNRLVAPPLYMFQGMTKWDSALVEIITQMGIN
jgi:hypothetical protein